MESKESFQKPVKEIKLNQFGNRIIENWCFFAQKKAEQEREKNKKKAVVSKVTEKDRQMFKEAYNKLRKQRAKSEEPLRKALKKLQLSRAVKRSKSERTIRKPCDNYVPCVIDYKKQEGNSTKNAKSQQSDKSKQPLNPRARRALVTIPPLKLRSKPWAPPSPPKRKPRPVVVIPPFKTRPWDPCQSRAKPKVKVSIEYPPLTLRKT